MTQQIEVSKLDSENQVGVVWQQCLLGGGLNESWDQSSYEIDSIAALPK